MTELRPVVVGAQGWIGSAIHAGLPGATAVSKPVDGTSILPSFDRSGPILIINAAGAKSGSLAQMQSDNVDLTAQLVELVSDTGGWLIQLGSAAEYGLSTSDQVVDEDTPRHPTSDYGKTKAAATDIVLAYERGTVLRPFNVVATPPQLGSPLADIRQRILDGVHSQRPIQVLSGGTVRDYVSLNFIVESVRAAVGLRLSGVFNLCSGVPVEVARIARYTADLLGSNLPVEDLCEFPATTIVGDPAAWQAASGLRQRLNAHDIARFLVADGS